MARPFYGRGSEPVQRSDLGGPKQNMSELLILTEVKHGGEGGIRTPDTLSGMPVFKTGAINHSATSPAATVLLQVRMSSRGDRPHGASRSRERTVTPGCSLSETRDERGWGEARELR